MSARYEWNVDRLAMYSKISSTEEYWIRDLLIHALDGTIDWRYENGMSTALGKAGVNVARADVREELLSTSFDTLQIVLMNFCDESHRYCVQLARAFEQMDDRVEYHDRNTALEDELEQLRANVQTRRVLQRVEPDQPHPGRAAAGLSANASRQRSAARIKVEGERIAGTDLQQPRAGKRPAESVDIKEERTRSGVRVKRERRG